MDSVKSMFGVGRTGNSKSNDSKNNKMKGSSSEIPENLV